MSLNKMSFAREVLSSDRFHGPLADSTRRKIRRIKRKHRSYYDPEDWSKFSTHSSYFCSSMMSTAPGIDVVHCEDLSVKDFITHYESINKPVIIDGLTQTWKARRRWRFDRLYRDFKNIKLKCGEDDNGRSLKLKVKYFLEYMSKQKDDSPLYVFDDKFGNKAESKLLLEDYSVPKYFREDLFKILGERRRPPYRWFLIGPQRSGSTVHTDPIGTSAWNTSLQGHKLWVLFPPETAKDVVKGKGLVYVGEDDEPFFYFKNILPRITFTHKIQPIYFVQRPGQTVFVPSKWWHAVLNLDDTLAVTQNFCSTSNFSTVWREMRKGRKRLSVVFLRFLEENEHQLGSIARQLNEDDGFIMWNDRPGYRSPSCSTCSSSSSSSS